MNHQTILIVDVGLPDTDIGKLGVPQAILRKPGPLDAQVWDIKRTRPQSGIDILNKSNAHVFKLADPIAVTEAAL